MSFLIYIPTIIFLIILIFYMIKGFINGFRKSVILFINMILTLLISILVFFIIFKDNFNENIVTFLDFFLKKIKHQKLYELLGTNIERELFTDYILDWFMLNYSNAFSNFNLSISELLILAFSFAEFIVRIAMLVVNIIIYIIFNLLSYIIYLIFFKEGRFKKKIQKQFMEGIRTKDYKKRRLLGLMIGTIRGLILGIIVLSFVGYICYSVTDGKYTDEEIDLIDEDLIGFDINPYIEIVNQYGKTGIGHILESIGGENGPWYLLIADSFLTSKYEVEIDGSIVEGSFNFREELGPIVNFVKDAYLLVRDYGFNVNDFNFKNKDDSNTLDFEYIVGKIDELFNKQLDGILFKDALDGLIAKFNLGSYTINLGQVLLQNALESFISLDIFSNLYIQKIINVLFYEEYSIKATKVINNTNFKTILLYLVDVAANLSGLLDFASSFDSNQSLVFGLVPLTEQTENNYAAIENILLSTSQLIDDLEFLSDKLLTNLLVCFVDLCISRVGNFEIEENIYNEYIISCNHFEPKKEIVDFLGLMKDMVSYFTKLDIKDTDSLMNEIIENIDDEDSEFRQIIDFLLNSSLSGIILNNPYIISYLSNMLYNSSNQLISLSTDIHLGSYYDNETIKKGDLYLIINNCLNVIKELYLIAKDNPTSQDIIKSIFKDDGISNTLISMVDSSNHNYVKTIHSIISSLLINIDNVMTDSNLRIIIEEQYIYRNIISSTELVEALKVIRNYIPIFFEDDFNYNDDLSVDLLIDIANAKLLRGTMAELIYSILKEDESYLTYIPSSYILGRGNESNLINWTKEDGEIDCLISIINSGNDENNLLDLLLNLETNSNNMLNEFLNLDYEILKNFEDSLLKSNVINSILRGNLENIKLDSGITLEVPKMSLEQIDDQYKIVRDLNIFTILKETNIFDVINTEESKIDVINYFLGEDVHIEKIFGNAILNSIMVQVLSGENNKSIPIIIPTSAYTEEAIIYHDTVVKTEEVRITIQYLKSLLNKDSSDNYDLNSFNYNEIFNIDISKCDIIGATFANILIKDLSNNNSTIVIPTFLKLQQNQLKEEYVTSGWKAEILNVIDGLNTMNITFIDNSSNVSIDVNKVVSELNDTQEGSNKTNLERIYSSNILKLTIKSEFDKISSSSTRILLPEDSLEVLSSNIEDTYISYTELSILSQVVNELNITNLSTFKVDEIFNDSTKFEFLDSALKDSYILRYNVTHYIENDTTLNSKILIPQIAFDLTTKSPMITQSEASGLISIIEICGNFDTFDYNNIIGNDNINDLLEISSILRFTITSNLPNDKLTIPNEVYEVYSLNFNNEKIIKSSELESLFNVIDILGLSSTSDFNFNNFLNLDAVKLINSSLIMRATVTDSIINNEKLVVSVRALDDLYSTNIIKEEELELFIDAIKSIEVNKLDDINISLSVVYDEIDIILKSEILLDTISFELYAEGGSLLEKDYNYISYFAKDNKDMYIIKEEEIKSYMNSIRNILGSDAKYGQEIDLNALDTNDAINAIKQICSSNLMLTTYSEVVENWLNNKFMINSEDLTIYTENICKFNNEFVTCSLNIINKEYVLNILNTLN